MINKILHGWTTVRIIYLLVGVILLIHTIMDHHVIGIFLGLYIVLMGLFGFGCARGSCALDENRK